MRSCRGGSRCVVTNPTVVEVEGIVGSVVDLLSVVDVVGWFRVEVSAVVGWFVVVEYEVVVSGDEKQAMFILWFNNTCFWLFV